MNKVPNRFFDEMAEDFFAECDELLAVIKKNLLRLDSMKNETLPPEIVEELLRSCHTLKGLTGMVGADETMKLTHSIESFLKSFNKRDSVFTVKSIDALFRSIGLVESQLEGLRFNKEITDSKPVISELEALMDDIPAERNTEIKNIIKEADLPRQGENVWKFLFTPSRELFDRGININDVRERINSLGKVLSSNPRTDEEGRITFEFVVVTDQPESTFSDWVKDGIVYTHEDLSSLSDPQPVQPGNTIRNKPLNLKNIVRVDLTRLDEIMRSVGDLVITRSKLNDFLQRFGSDLNAADNLSEIDTRFERKIREVREGIMKLRLVSTGEAFERMRFVVRDLVRENEKIINLKIYEGEALVDKFIMDKIFDPLLHIVRNAISHGIETPGERILAGKPQEASLLLKASSSGSSVIFEIADDGRGVDREEISNKAKLSGLISHGQEITDDDILNILCSPGFTTKEKTDLVSGRGVGMDVVRKAVSELGGHLEMFSEKGKGTKFVLTLPLTLAIVEALILKSGGRVFAIPMTSVEEVSKIDPEKIIRFERNEVINHRGFVLPLIRLNTVFNLNNSEKSDHIIVISHGAGKIGLLIDRITGQREIVVSSISDPLLKVTGIYGVTDLGDGRIVLSPDFAIPSSHLAFVAEINSGTGCTAPG